MPSSHSRPVVLITGAARRLGRAIAVELAHGGCDIAVHYRHSADDAQACAAYVRALGVRAECFAADLADEAACRELLPTVAEQMGRVDAVVNNASLFEYDDADSFSYAAMELHWRANTAPAIVLAQALAQQLRGGRNGCVVNLLDQKLWNPNPDYLSYTLSKAALEAQRRCWRRPWRHRCAWRRGAGCDAGIGAEDERGALCHRAHDDAAGPQFDTRRRGAHRALPDRVARDHRHHHGCRRRPAPGRAAARRGLPA